MQAAVTALCSSIVIVADSPVVPQGTRPVLPSAICQSTNASKVAKSTDPSRNGVTSAGMEP